MHRAPEAVQKGRVTKDMIGYSLHRGYSSHEYLPRPRLFQQRGGTSIFYHRRTSAWAS
jgi:hypothetical protein